MSESLYSFKHETSGKDECFRVTWCNEPCRNNEMAVVLHQDGCITFTNTKKFLYPAESEAFAAALQAAIAFRAAREKASRDAWWEENGDKKEIFGYAVDLSPKETQRFFETCHFRTKGKATEVRYQGRWLHLCRTDLKDDVCTWSPGQVARDLVKHYKTFRSYGARIRDRGFAVVDAFSDG